MRKSFQRLLALVFVASALVLGGCSLLGGSNTASNQTTASASQSSDRISTPASKTADASPSPSQTVAAVPAGLPRLNGKAIVEMTVKYGKVTMELDGINAPITAGNFTDLVKRGVYDGLMFHRVVREPEPFVVQGGDPESKNPSIPVERLGTGSFIDPATNKARYIPLEIKPEGATTPVYHQEFKDAGVTKPPKLKHKRGALAMARSMDPDSASAQFYIALGDINFLDGRYAVFGYVTEGMELIDKVQKGDRIQSIKIIQGVENLKTGGKP